MLRSYDAATLRTLPPEQTTHVTIEGGTASVTTVREETEGGVIVVVQAFAPTIKFPSYISFSAIGHLIAEGIIIAPDGGVTEAPEELMWGYR